MSEKNLDKKNRWRNKVIAFRMSPEEDEKLERLVAASGLTKQEYIISRLENRKMNLIASPRVYKNLCNEMRQLRESLQSYLDSSIEIQEDVVERLEDVAEVLEQIDINDRR